VQAVQRLPDNQRTAVVLCYSKTTATTGRRNSMACISRLERLPAAPRNSYATGYKMREESL
jgi:hypothetical protein